MLQTQHRRFQIIPPIARISEQMLPHPIAFNKMNPLTPRKTPEKLAHIKSGFAKISPAGADRYDPVVIARSGDNKGLSVERQKIIMSAAMIDVTSHQIDSSRSANDHDFAVEAETFAKNLQNFSQLFDFCRMQASIIPINSFQPTRRMRPRLFQSIQPFAHGRILRRWQLNTPPDAKLPLFNRSF